jgi:hypothetical protein
MAVVLATFRKRTEAKAEAIGALYGQDWLAVPEEALRCALAELAAPDAIFVPEPEPGRDQLAAGGIGDALAMFAAAREEWTSCRYLVEELEQLGDQVLVAGKLVAESRPSGDRACFGFAHVWTFEGGLAARVAAYPSRVEGRRALTPGNRP